LSDLQFEKRLEKFLKQSNKSKREIDKREKRLFDGRFKNGKGNKKQQREQKAD
jgi:hypothetical protein